MTYDLDSITPILPDPEPNWEQARNDQSKPLADGSPIPKEFLYYDHNIKAYVFDPGKKAQKITLEVFCKPEMTDEFFFKVTKQLPKWLPIPYDVPIGLEISVYHSKIGSVYQVGESSIEWVKWIVGHFERSVWASENQISAVGCEVRYGPKERFVMTIVMA